MPQGGDRLDIATEPASIVQSAGWRREPQARIRTQGRNREDNFLSQQTSFTAGEGGRSVKDCHCYVAISED